jgi:hypothetical protein
VELIHQLVELAHLLGVGPETRRHAVTSAGRSIVQSIKVIVMLSCAGNDRQIAVACRCGLSVQEQHRTLPSAQVNACRLDQPSRPLHCAPQQVRIAPFWTTASCCTSDQGRTSSRS